MNLNNSKLTIMPIIPIIPIVPIMLIMEKRTRIKTMIDMDTFDEGI